VLIAIFIASKLLGVFKTTGKTEENATAAQTDSVVTMIAVTGMSLDDARDKLYDLGLEVTAEYEASATVEKGQVLKQDIAEGQTVAAGSQVQLTVSSGKDGVSVPDVTNLSEAEARVTLEKEGFSMVKDESASDTVEKGNVVSQNPGAGESVEKGSTITVIISTGKSTNSVTVPDIRLQTLEDAKAKLSEAGLTYPATIEEEYSDVVPAGCVVSQSYAPNMTVDEGTEIVFTVSKGAEDKLTYYKCNLSVNAPSTYAGGVATVTLTQTDTNTVLFQTKTTSFPVAINVTNIQGSANATITIEYTIDNTVITENEDGSINSVTTQDTKKETQAVTLTPQ